MLGFNGGLMGVRKVPNSGSAPGLWFQNEQSVAKRAGIWPGPLGPFRYWRFANFADTALDANAFDLTEIELNDSNGLITGITASTNFPWNVGYGPSSKLVDGTKSASNRALRDNWNVIQEAANLTFDLGSAKTVVSLQVFSLYHSGSNRFPASFDLQCSADNVNYSLRSTITVGSFTHQGGEVYANSLITL